MKRVILVLFASVTLMTSSGCGVFEGYFLHQGASEDVGLLLDVNGTVLESGRVYLFPASDPVPTAVYDLVNSVLGPGLGVFTSDLVNIDDPGDTGTVSGTQVPGTTTVALHLDSGDRNEALGLVEPKGYDPYECWGAEAGCHVSFDTPTCTVTPGVVSPQGPTVNIFATVPFKDHDGILPGALLGVGWKKTSGSGMGYDVTRTVPGSILTGYGQLTTTLFGTTEGTMTYDFTNAFPDADATDLIIEIDAAAVTPGYFGFSNQVYCPLG